MTTVATAESHDETRGPRVAEPRPPGPAGAPMPPHRESESRPARGLPYPLAAVLLAAVYFLAGKLGLTLAIVHASATAVWPPTGIALAGLLSLGYRFWPSIFVGAFLVNATTAGSIATSLGIASGNTLEALVGAYLVNRFANGTHSFKHARDTIRFAILAGMVSTAVSATVGVTSLAAGGFAGWADYGAIWLTWWLGDLGGAMVVAPVLILWGQDYRLRWSRAQVLEAGVLLLSLLAVGQAVFGWLVPLEANGYPLAFLCMPLLIWAAFRFDQRITASAILVLSAVALWGSLQGTGLSERMERNVSLLLLQVFMGVTAVTTLALAAVISERKGVEEAVRGASEELRAAATELEAFSLSISHDLRSPLGAVVNYSAIIEEDFNGRLDDEGIRLLRRIRASAETATRLLDQLAQYAWAGRDEGEERDVDMSLLAREAYAEVVAGEEEAGDLRLELRDLPPARGSAVLLGRVFRNLFSNAAKYSRGRAARCIEVNGEAGEWENTYCVIDNGIGFDPEHVDTMFLPFRRLSRAKEFEGSGLGLAIAAKIVRKHGGRIWAESDGASGARFCFTLPKKGSGL